MGSEAKTNGGGGGAGGFRARMERYLYSGDKKHVLAGIAVITIIFGAPWFLMNREIHEKMALNHPFGMTEVCAESNNWTCNHIRNKKRFGAGSKHQSHQDYMEKADKARRERLSPSSK